MAVPPTAVPAKAEAHGGGACAAAEWGSRLSPRRRFWLSVQAVEAEGAAGHHLVLRLGRQALHALAHHLGRAWKEAVWVRVIGRPHDLMRPDIVGEHLEAALDRLEGDPAIALEQLARPGLQLGIVEPLIVEMPVHAVEPGRDPAAARLQEADAELRMLFAHPAPDHRETGQHHLHRMGDDVAGAAPLETVDPDLWHPGRGALMETDRQVEILGGGPEWLVHRVVNHLVAVIRVRADEAGAEIQLLPREAHLRDRQIDIL